MTMKISFLDGGRGAHRNSTEEEAGSSEEVTLLAQVIPAVEPGLKDGRVRRETCSQTTVVDGHEISHQHEGIGQDTDGNCHHKVSVAPHSRGLTEALVHSIGVYEVSEKVTAPQEEDFSQHMRDDTYVEPRDAFFFKDLDDTAEHASVFDFSTHKLGHTSHRHDMKRMSSYSGQALDDHLL